MSGYRRQMFAGYLRTAALHDDVGQVQTELGGHFLKPVQQQRNHNGNNKYISNTPTAPVMSNSNDKYISNAMNSSMMNNSNNKYISNALNASIMSNSYNKYISNALNASMMRLKALYM